MHCRAARRCSYKLLNITADVITARVSTVLQADEADLTEGVSGCNLCIAKIQIPADTCTFKPSDFKGRIQR